MFGFCDASVLCPKYENNAHTGWVGNVLPAGIKGVFEQIERDEFHAGPTKMEQRDEIVETALEELTSQWEDNPFDMSTDASDLEFSVQDDDSESETKDKGDQIGDTEQQELPVVNGDDELKGVDETYNETNDDENNNASADPEPEPVLKCQTRQRTFESGETVDVRVIVENPEGTERNNYEIEGEVEDESGNTTELDPKEISLAEGDTSGGADGWEFDPSDKEGKFVFRAQLYPQNDAKDTLDSTNTYFFVGEQIEDETGQPKQTFIENIELFPDPDDDEFRHELQEGDEAFILIANPSHPEYRYAEKMDGRNAIENQVALLVRWGQEAIMNYLLLDRLEAELQNQVDTDGSPLDEIFTDFVRREIMENLSAFSARTYEDLI
jgi:hypothetical protein